MILDNLYLPKPKISIILLSFKIDNFIEETIKSCINQTFIDFELIIINEYLADNNEIIIKNYKDSDNRIKLFQNKEPNKQLSVLLNSGFRKSNGEYFTWILGNNIFHPTALEKMNQVLDTMNEIGLVYADYTIINDDGKIKHRLYQDGPEYLPINNCIGLCFMYRSILLKKIGGYDEKFVLLEDYEYWLRISLVTKLYHINESLYFSRTNNQYLTKYGKKEISKAEISLKEKFKDKFMLNDTLKPINDLYICFIAPKSFKIYIKLLLIILINPIITLSYITKHLKRTHYIN